MRLHHVVEAQEFNRGMLEELFAIAGQMERVVWEGGSKLLDGKIMSSLFYEESTRTRFSFETAMHRLGNRATLAHGARPCDDDVSVRRPAVDRSPQMAHRRRESATSR